MIAVDTSVLLRYLLQDDEEQAARAGGVFAASKTILITDIVLAETVWTLSGRKYGLPKAQLVAVLERLFSEPSIRFEDDEVVWRALHAYRSDGATDATASTKRVGFADALIVFKALRTAASDGELLDGVYTFDAAMQRLPNAMAPEERVSWPAAAKGDELNELRRLPPRPQAADAFAPESPAKPGALAAPVSGSRLRRPRTGSPSPCRWP